MSERNNTHRKQRAGLPKGTRALALGSSTALLASLGVALAALPAQAAVTFTVSVAGNDTNPCNSGAPCKTVQRAVNLANDYGSPQVVTINVGAGTFTEAAGVVMNYGTSSPKPTSVTIVGAGADKTTIQPGPGMRVFGIVGDFPVTLKAMKITGGAPAAAAVGTSGQPGAAGAAGGGVYKASGSGSLTLTDVLIDGNSAGNGGKGFDGPNGPVGLTTGAGNGFNGTPGTNGGAGGTGGGVAYLGTGNLVIERSTISGNKAGYGGEGGKGGNGGQGDTSLLDGKGGNGAAGGNGGAGAAGGGIAFAGGALTITNSTILLNLSGRGGNGGAGGAGGRGGDSTPENDGGNGALGGNGGNAGDGGGIELAMGAVSAALTHVTLAANSVHVGGNAGPGGAAGVGINPPLTSAAIAGADGNGGLLTTSAGLHRAAGTITMAASLLWNPESCTGTAGFLTATNSVASDDSCFATNPGTGLKANEAGAANLGQPALNGGTTPTAALTAGNPAVDAVPAVACAATDQRGQTRPGLSGPTKCAAGAFEPQVPPVGPTLSGVISAAHPKTKYDWYRDTVTVTFTCTPGSSPLTAPCPSPMVITTQGANQGGTVTITNQQGLTSSIKVAVNIDKGLPKIAIKGVKKGQLYNKVRKVRCVATDSLSGPFVCQLKATGKLVKGNTQVRVNYVATAVDRAGNTSTKKGHYFFKRTA